MGSESFITDLTNTFVRQCNLGIIALTPDIYGLITTLGIIQIAIDQIFNLGERDPIKMLVRSFLKIGFFILLAERWAEWCGYFKDSFILLGVKAGGIEVSLANAKEVLNPSFVSEKGVTLCGNVFDSIVSISGASVSATLSAILLKIALALLIFFCFVVMSTQIFLTIVEFHIVKVMAFVLLPFGILKYTSFLAERAIGAIWSYLIKLFALAFIMAATYSMIDQWNTIDASSTSNILRALIGCVVMAGAVWVIPNIVQGFLAGGFPALDGRPIVGSAWRGGSRAASAVWNGATGIVNRNNAAKAAGMAAAGGYAVYKSAQYLNNKAEGIKQFGRSIAHDLHGVGQKTINPFNKNFAQNTSSSLNSNMQRLQKSLDGVDDNKGGKGN